MIYIYIHWEIKDLYIHMHIVGAYIECIKSQGISRFNKKKSPPGWFGRKESYSPTGSGWVPDSQGKSRKSIVLTALWFKNTHGKIAGSMLAF